MPPSRARRVAIAVVGVLLLAGLALLGIPGGAGHPRPRNPATRPWWPPRPRPPPWFSPPRTPPTIRTSRDRVRGRAPRQRHQTGPSCTPLDYHPDAPPILVHGSDRHDRGDRAREFLPRSARDGQVRGRRLERRHQGRLPGLGQRQVRLYEASLDASVVHAEHHRLHLLAPLSRLRPDRDQDRLRPARGQRKLAESGTFATGATTKLDATVGPRANAVPELFPACAGCRWRRRIIRWRAWPPARIPGRRHRPLRRHRTDMGVLSLVDVATGAVTDVLQTGSWAWSRAMRTGSRTAKSIVFSAAPASTTGSVSADFAHTSFFAIARDGTGQRTLPGSRRSTCRTASTSSTRTTC